MDHDDMLANFQAMTGQDATYSKGILEASNWNLNQAVDLFFQSQSQSQGISSTSSTSTSNVQQGATSSSTNPPQVPLDHDADAASMATINALLAQDTSNASPQVRAPIPAKRARLYDQTNMMPSNNTSADGGMTAFRDFQAEARSLEAKILNNNMNTTSTENHQNRTASTSSASSSSLPFVPPKTERLNDLYAAPTDIMFPGSFSDARDLGKVQRKWVLVNIQSNEQFVSHILNRDVWSDDLIKSFVKESFIFFQHEINHEEAQRYKVLYKIDVNKLPHVAIIDPRTGEKLKELRLKSFEKNLQPFEAQSRMMEQLNNFLERNTLTDIGFNSNSNQGQHLEQQQSMPMVENQQSNAESVPFEEPTAMDTGTGNEISSQNHNQNLTDYTLPEEPPSSENVITLRFKLFDGSTKTRRFSKDSLVSELYFFVQCVAKEAQSKDFFLLFSFPPKPLDNVKNQTLEEAGLFKDTVTARFK